MDPVLVAGLTIGTCFVVSILALLSGSGELVDGICRGEIFRGLAG